jgi:hypothetical protein
VTNRAAGFCFARSPGLHCAPHLSHDKPHHSFIPPVAKPTFTPFDCASSRFAYNKKLFIFLPAEAFSSEQSAAKRGYIKNYEDFSHFSDQS